METTIEIQTAAIPLAALLKLAGLAPTGGQAKRWVQEGCVAVNGRVERRRGAQIRPGDVVDVAFPDEGGAARLRVATA